MPLNIKLDPVERMQRDLLKQVREAAREGANEMRLLCANYYAMQDMRIRSNNQRAALDRGGENQHLVLDYFLEQTERLEGQVERALSVYSELTVPGQWLRSIVGIGPVLAANFLAHLDVTRSVTAGGFWRFAGLDPTLTWEKGQKRPFNAELKTACWKASSSWVKFKGKETCFYGHLYTERKAFEVARNDSGHHAAHAKAQLQKKRYGQETEARAAYEAGRLPPAHVDAMTRRWVVKLFLAHLHHVMYEHQYGEPPPKPYVLEHAEGHAHIISPPNWPMVAGERV